MIVLTAVVPRGALPPDTDVDGRDIGPVTVLYEEVSDAPPPGRSAILEHGRRIVDLAELMPLLPMRYGTTVADSEELVELAGPRADEWSRRLAHVAGRCELVVHVDLPEVTAPPGPAQSGRAYLEARMTRLRRHERALAEVRRVLASWTEETRVLPDGRRLAVLLDKGDAEAARLALNAWGEESGTATSISGPWPAFSFCEEEPS
jgi:hypothetical protein